MTSLPFLSAVALSTGPKRKQKLEANAEFLHGNTKNFTGRQNFDRFSLYLEKSRAKRFKWYNSLAPKYIVCLNLLLAIAIPRVSPVSPFATWT